MFNDARHVEVQLIGDGHGEVVHLWERECSLQRQRQKLVEIAPAPVLDPALRQRVLDAAVALAAAVGYRSLGTAEFLVASDMIAFLELNARVQFEHPVTEEVTGVNLVGAQRRIAAGATLGDLELRQEQIAPPRGFAVQARVNLETMQPDGSVRPAGGILSAYEPPSGPDIRTDGYGYSGYATSPSYDSLIAKVIGYGSDITTALRRTARALAEFRIEGAAANVAFQRVVLAMPEIATGRVHTRIVEERLTDLLATAAAFGGPVDTAVPALAGTRVASDDPLAVLALGKSGEPAQRPSAASAPTAVAAVVGPDGTVPVIAPIQGTIVSLAVGPGDEIAVGAEVLVMESMKMEHVVHASVSGVVRLVTVLPGRTVRSHRAPRRRVPKSRHRRG